MRHNIYVRKKLVGGHNIGVVPSAHGICNNYRGIAVPFRQLFVFRYFGKLPAFKVFKPRSVYLARVMPVTFEKSHDHGVRHGVVLPEVTAGKVPELRFHAAGNAVNVDSL